MKITSLTKEQEQKIPEYINKWINLASQPINRDKALKLANKIWEKEKPLILFSESIENTKNLILFILQKFNIKKERLDSQLDSQLDNQLFSQLYNQLHRQLDSQLDNQLHRQLHRQLDSQFNSQLDSQLDNQLFSQLYNQLHRQLDSHLDSQLHIQLDSQLHSKLHSQLDEQKIVYSRYVSFYLYDWGGMYDYGKYIGLKFDNLQAYIDILLNLPICICIGNIVFICEKPIVKWQDKKLHSEIQPAIRWLDNTGFYYLNGMSFEKDLWEKIVKKTLTAEEAIKLKNQEQRTIALKYIGFDKLMKECNGKQISKDEYGEIVELDLLDINKEKMRYYISIDPSKNEKIALLVSPETKSPKEAMTKAYKIDIFGLNYQPNIRT